MIRQDQSGRIHFRDDSRTLDAVARLELGAVIDRRLAPAVADIDARPLRRRRLGSAPPRDTVRHREGFCGPSTIARKSDEFVRCIEGKGEELLVHSVEARRDAGEPVGAEIRRRDIDGELHALPRIAHVDLVERLLPRKLHSLSIERLGGVLPEFIQHRAHFASDSVGKPLNEVREASLRSRVVASP